MPNQLLLIEPKKLAVVFLTVAGDFDLLLDVDDEDEDLEDDVGGCCTASVADLDAETEVTSKVVIASLG